MKKILRNTLALILLISAVVFAWQCSQDSPTSTRDLSNSNSKLGPITDGASTDTVRISLKIYQVYSPIGDCPGAVEQLLLDTTETVYGGVLTWHSKTITTLDSLWYLSESCGYYSKTGYRIERSAVWNHQAVNRFAWWSVFNSEWTPQFAYRSSPWDSTTVYQQSWVWNCNTNHTIYWGITSVGDDHNVFLKNE